MNADLSRFLSTRQALATDFVTWGRGEGGLKINFRVDAYLSEQRPPVRYITSVRGILLQDESLLVVANPDGHHIWPGGRRHKGERLEQTLRREVLEETSWAIRSILPLGFMHFHHLTPKPDNHAYPYPDFLWTIYTAEAFVPVPGGKLDDDYELEAVLHPIVEAPSLSLSAPEQLYLDAAIRLRPSFQS